MNFGRFFKLNQNLSSTVNGLTIFDYTELPAYEGLDSNNPMTPKFPISVSITDNAVRFKMHYCVYRCSNDVRQATQQEDKESYPYYGFSIDDIRRNLYKNHPKETYEHDLINVVHIEEIILELPFSGFKAKSLTEIIKKSYIASFPQLREGEEKNNKKMTGNLFLDKLIEKSLFDHDINSDAVSYSTLWLMDLYDNDSLLCLRREKDGLIDKFLRKLLLDFMFDLKHSDVFQISVNYDRMYSGLMSDYYFSALMHKCEYYYYRNLTTQAIKTLEEKKAHIKLSNKPEEYRKEILDKEEKQIIVLYGKELCKTEEQWANDIRNPMSEKYFGHDIPDDFSKTGNTKWGRLMTEMCSLFGERMSTSCWDYWFASPEEEMRRIFFPFKTYKENRDMCNSIIFSEHFCNSDGIKEINLLSRESRGITSRWFLNRYDFNDVLHLHLFKRANSLFLAIAITILFLLWYSGSIERLSSLLSFSYQLINHLPSIIMIIVLLAFTIAIAFRLWHIIMDTQYNSIEIIHFQYIIKKICLLLQVTVTILLALFVIRSFLNNNIQCWTFIVNFIFLVLFVVYLIAHLFLREKTPFNKYIRHYMSVSIHPVKSGHLFLPKLTASIMTAWLTLSRGLQYFIPFFESYFYVITLIVIVFGFILFQINRVCPANSACAKVFKSVEFLIISYFISLIVGLVVLNFAGKHYLIEQEYYNEEHTEYIDKNSSSVVLFYYKNDGNKDNIKNSDFLNHWHNFTQKRSGEKQRNNNEKYEKINLEHPKVFRTVIRLPLIGSTKGILIIPRLLLMSSVLAMFVGVFLQMLFFQEKQMTDI